MLNYETLLSSYDDKLTLMQWLKKVEEALKNASAISFDVNKRGDATLTFSIKFEDGTELESGPFTLEQGESVESAAIINGNLFLTLTNGYVLDAGNLFNGNITLGGNLTAQGTIKASSFDGLKIEEIKDADGHNRFIEGTLLNETIPTGMTLTYKKWSLSGTHLMIVLAGGVLENTTIGTSYIVSLYPPAWVLNKLFPVWASNKISLSTIYFMADDWSNQQAAAVLTKASTYMAINLVSPITIDKDRNFRIQFDLLIDNA